MAVQLVTKFLPLTDELFATESKSSLFTNQDFAFSGAHSVKIYKVGTSEMQDYGRRGAASGNWSRYGNIQSLDAETEEFTLQRDRSFTFAIDSLDQDETGQQLAAASALARQLRLKIVPEVDSFIVEQMIAHAGHVPDPVVINCTNIYDAVLSANEALDDSEVPESGRVLIVNPKSYAYLKKALGNDLKAEENDKLILHGVVASFDGLRVIKMPRARLPENFGFLIAHPIATTAPQKLASFITHTNPPGISGDLVEGRLVYGAFVRENSACALYYQALPAPEEETEAAGSPT